MTAPEVLRSTAALARLTLAVVVPPGGSNKQFEGRAELG